MDRRLFFLPLLCGFGFFLLAGCGDSGGPRKQQTFQGQYPINVVCTTGMVADLVKNVGGNHVRVTQIMGEDVDPHLYKASSGDVSLLSNADVIFYSGLHLEGKMTDIFARLAGERPVFAVADGIDPQQILRNEEQTSDPHVWFDVSLWNQARGYVQQALSKYDPAHAADYQVNGSACQAELDKLHDYARTQIATIPKEQRVLVTAHDAFRYFGRAYDIEVKGIQGISTESEASVKDINDLVEFIVRRRIKAVFVETSVNQRNMRSLIEGCRARGHEVVIGGSLFSDAMGKDGTPEGTYVGMVRHNVDTIVHALK